MIIETLSYAGLRALLWPFSLLPYRALHVLGKGLGTIVYYCVPKFRKRALSNLALASSLKLSSDEIVAIAKGSLQNVAITCLEYAKLAREKDISRIATCENPEEALAHLEKGKGVIFFCGHQANWELLFLEGTSRMPGVAIGRPTKNKRLYRWVIGMRQKFGGTIIEPKHAVKEGLRALKRNCFLGIVGDQGMPKGGFVSDFLGRKAYTSPLPAILAYRTGAPLFVATVHRAHGRYTIRYSHPLYADTAQEMESEIARLMHEALRLFEASIVETPDQWLWQHNRWKQQIPETIKRVYRYDTVCVLLPAEEKSLEALLPHLHVLRAIYPTEHFAVAAPKRAKDLLDLPSVHWRFYENEKELFTLDYASKIVFNFTGIKALSRHYRKHSAFQTLTLEDLWQIAGVSPGSLELPQLFHKALYHAG